MKCDFSNLIDIQFPHSSLQLREMANKMPNRTFAQNGNVFDFQQSSSHLVGNAYDGKPSTPRSIPLSPNEFAHTPQAYPAHHIGSYTKLSGNYSTTVSTTKETHVEKEWVEQNDAGVYITLVTSPGGTKDLKRVRFRFAKAL